MDRGLLVDGSEDGTLLRLGGVEGGREVELEALGDLVLELNLGAEEVRGGPGLWVLVDVAEKHMRAGDRASQAVRAQVCRDVPLVPDHLGVTCEPNHSIATSASASPARSDTHLGHGEAVLEVDVLALNVTVDGVRLGVAGAGNLEGDVGGGEGLDLERGALDGVVLEEEVGRRLAEVLVVVSVVSKMR